MAAKNKPNEIYITRIYDAPVKTVWEAWTDTKQVAKWWGPRGFTLTTHSKDVKTGGHWNYIMHGPDGVDYPNKTVYLEVETYAKLVYDHGANDDQPALFRVTVLFSEREGKTTMEMSMVLATAEAADTIKKHIKKMNGNSTWDRLAEFLADEVSHRNTFVINRSFEAPLEIIYEMFTDSKHFGAWLPPTGATMEFIRGQIQVGATTFWRMDGAHGAMFGRAKYLEMTRPNRIVYTQQFVDKDEKISRHPMAPTWPETMLTTIELAAEDQSKTRVTITWEPYGSPTVDEIETFKKAREGMTLGWTGSFDKLEDYLAKRIAPTSNKL